MKNELPLISSRRLHSIRTQGYCDYSDANLSELAFGNRFAYYLCSFFLLIRSDYSQYHGSKRNDGSFNILLSKPLNKPELPRRSKQLKFACIVSTIWLATIIYLFYSDLALAGYVSGGVLFSIAFLVSTTDFCIPSLVYNFLYKYKVK